MPKSWPAVKRLLVLTNICVSGLLRHRNRETAFWHREGNIAVVGDRSVSVAAVEIVIRTTDFIETYIVVRTGERNVGDTIFFRQ